MIDEFWRSFLKDKGFNSNIEYTDSYYFGFDEKTANELLELVLLGKKLATSSALISYELCSENLPKIGDYNVITDFVGNPRCVIYTKNVRFIPFNEMTFEICKSEGEDECLETWREKHKKFFIEDGKELGYEFSEDMIVVFENFEVVHKF
ncbi:ASCH domain-containing protein [Actinomyces sp. zg-332]|uniref:ASCH domain-containing protein n=1 Tax=Actinomyces sp. zg-332 TaxID=2708340 RepID=UPI0018E0A949|nr:ASCH domain-containing protein [Actinomyces sp. zg-332]QPK93826.1 ASCH domain-containing protein [Actinomyces sp. zg-332]